MIYFLINYIYIEYQTKIKQNIWDTRFKLKFYPDFKFFNNKQNIILFVCTCKHLPTYTYMEKLYQQTFHKQGNYFYKRIRNHYITSTLITEKYWGDVLSWPECNLT